VVVLTIFAFIIFFSLPYLKLFIHSIVLRRICAISFIYASVLNYNTLYIQSIGSGIGLYSGLFQVNILSCVISIFILLISGIITIIWPSFLNNISTKGILPLTDKGKGEVKISLALTQSKNKDKFIDSVNMQQSPYFWIGENTRSNEYCVIILFNILGALFLISSSDLISMYLSIELQSFGLYILTSIYKENLSSTSAGLKYFLLGGLSSCIILLGSGFIYTYTGLTNLESIYSLISVYFDSNFINSFSV
jgi:NADH-ubiquinone oxidoreductase chain 2